jgi:copper resistance protein D
VTIAFGLIVARFLHFLAAAVLCGAAAFPFYGIPRPNIFPFRPEEGATQLAVPWLRGLSLISATVALLSALLWLGFTAAGMSGSAAGAMDPSILSLVLTGSDFGRVWALRLVLAVFIVLALIGKPLNYTRLFMAAAGALVLLASIALTGHAWADANGGWLHILADALHLVAAGVWIGALFVLLRLATVFGSQASGLHQVLAHFSGVGTILIGVLILTGAVNSWFLIGPEHVFELFATSYGVVLSLKLALFLLMLVLAALNRFRLTPALLKSDPAPGLRALKLSIALETILGALVLFAVGWLGTLAPPMSAE